jgi:hypothetical protein
MDSYVHRQQAFETMLFEIIDENDNNSIAFKNANDFIYFVGKLTNNINYISLAKQNHDDVPIRLSEFGFNCLETLGYFNIKYNTGIIHV